MIVSDSKKFIFIHNPKTAGMSIHEALEQFGNCYSKHQEKSWFKRYNQFFLKKLVGNIYARHTPAWRVKKHLPAKWDSYMTFGVVRNPYNRAYSYYKFLKKNKDKDWQKMNTNMSFEEYIFSIRKADWIDHQHYYFCAQESTQLIVDRVIKLEDLTNEFDKLCTELGIDGSINVPHLNATDKKENYLSHYNEQMIAEVNELFANDFNLFGYQKL